MHSRFTLIRNLLLVPMALLALNAKSQTYSNLYSFSSGGGANSDGREPNATVTLSGRTLYGTCRYGGSNTDGTIFSVNIDGTGFTNLHNFTGGASDGTQPWCTLNLYGNTLFGTCNGGGTAGVGTIFRINNDGTDYTNLYSFTNGYGGQFPQESPILVNGTLYGTSFDGGTSSDGILYAISSSGTGFTNLHNFGTGNDGNHPWGQVILVGNTLYGMAQNGGTNGNGTIYAINTNGTGYSTVYSFTGGADGSLPRSGLLYSGGLLYGVTWGGGQSGNGTIFSVNTNGTGFNTLWKFTGGSDGAHGWCTLIQSGPTLYGACNGGGSGGVGTIFSINTNGTSMTGYYGFSNGTNGEYPQAGVALLDNTLYGETVYAGVNGNGMVYSFVPPPPSLGILASGIQNVVYWPDTGNNYSLQSTTNLSSPDWQPVSNAVPLNAFIVTNQGANQYFRLQAN